MTREYRRLIKCPSCGHKFEGEEPIKAWLRKHPRLDSIKERLVLNDCDLIVHKYARDRDRVGDREVELLMLVEIKTQGADTERSQRDTLNLAGQMLSNRRTVKGRSIEAYSTAKGRMVPVRSFGFHLWQLSGLTPADSQVMHWDRKLVDVVTILKLLRFEADPHTLQKFDLRRHHTGPADLWSGT